MHTSLGLWPRTRTPLISFVTACFLLFPLMTTAEGSPEVPQPTDDLATMTARMAKIGACWSPSFSPDGQHIAFISDLNGIPQVWIVPTEGGFPRLVTALEDQVGSVRWSPVADELVFSLAPGGGMNQQIYAIQPDGTGLRRLTDGGLDNNWLGAFSHDGRFLSYSSNRRDPGSMDVWMYDFQDDVKRRMVDNQGIGSLADMDSETRTGIVYRMVSRGDDNLYWVDFESGHEQLLTPHEPPGSFGGGTFAADDRTIYFSTNAERDLIAFARLQVDATGKPGEVEILAERSDAELQSFQLSHAGNVAALIWNRAGRNEMQLLDLKSLKDLAVPEMPTEILGGLEFSPDDSTLAFVASGAATPSDIWTLGLADGNLSRVTSSPHPGVDLDRLVRPELVSYLAHDGEELSGWLYRPLPEEAEDAASQSQEPAPFVISFHGGPEGQSRPSFSSTFQALVSQGIGVLSPNVRGSSGFGKRFVNLDNGALRFDAIKDIEASANFLVEGGYAYKDQLGIMGGSYGGYMTMAGLAWYPDLFAAGANLFGVVNFETFFEHTEAWMAAISKVEYGDPDTQGDLLRELSPIHKIDLVKAPTLVLHGANDTNVPVVEAEQVVEKLKARDVPVEYVLFADEGHGFRKTPNRTRMVVEIVRWFETYLKAAD